MEENLVQHRGEPTVWDRDSRLFPSGFDVERWIATLAAGALVVTGIRRGPAAALMGIAGGGLLAWWAVTSREGRQRHRGRLLHVCQQWSPRAEDMVNEAAEESFPASDAPAFTPPQQEPGRTSARSPRSSHQ